MIKQSNELVALEWLIDPLNQEFWALHAHITPSPSELLAHFARQYDIIGNVLVMANLPDFTKLAQTIAQTADYFTKVGNPAVLAPKIIYASHLLQHEINRYATTGFLRRPLLNSRIYYLNLVGAHLGGKIGKQSILQSVVHERFSEQIDLKVVQSSTLDDKSYQEINQVWRALAGQLIQSGVNGEQLTKLRNLSTHLAGAAVEPVLQKLWLVTVLWLENTALNTKPLPSYYAHILGELDRVIAFQKAGITPELEASIWLENVIADIYVALANLDTLNEQAHNFLKRLNEILTDNQTFFSHVLTTIEGLIFALADNKIETNVLSALQEQLSARGWSFYARYVEQIINDATTAQSSDEMFAQMQWQINTQLQDLYTAITSTAEVINTKDNHHDEMIVNDNDVLRDVRILMEEFKDKFLDYLQDKQTDKLPSSKSFEVLVKSFNDLGLFDAATVATKMAEVFTLLQDKSPNHLSWQIAHKTAESLSLFEMFLDNLAQQIFDHALLTRIEECTDDVQKLLLDANLNEPELSDVEMARRLAHQHTTLYDDAGEHLPALSSQTHLDDAQQTLDVDTNADMDLGVDLDAHNEQVHHAQDVVVSHTDELSVQNSTQDNHQDNHQDEHQEQVTNALPTDDVSVDDDVINTDANADADNVSIDDANLDIYQDAKTVAITPDEHANVTDTSYQDVNHHNTQDDQISQAFQDDFDDLFDDTLTFDDNFGIDDIKTPTKSETADEMKPAFDVADDELFDDIFVDEPVLAVNQADDQSQNQNQRLDDDQVQDESQAISHLPDEDIELDLFDDSIALTLDDDELDDDELVVDELPDQEPRTTEDGVYVTQEDDEILLSDYVNEGTVDNVVPSLASSELLVDEPLANDVIEDEAVVDDVDVAQTDDDQDVSAQDVFDEVVFDDEMIGEDDVDDIMIGENESEDKTDDDIDDKMDDGLGSKIEPKLADDPIKQAPNEPQSDDEEQILIGEDDVIFDDDFDSVNDDVIFDDADDIDDVDDTNNVNIADTADEKPAQIESDGQVTGLDETEQDVVDDEQVADGLSEVYLAAKASLKEDDFSHDEEFREIFIEEVDEVMEEMHTHLPKWQADPQNLKPLKEVRRNWHTLKGSGRMVGAFQVGETAWAIENMLNRVLDETVKVSPDVVAIVSETAQIIPVMVQDFANSQPPSVDNALVVMRANNILAGRPMDEGKPDPADKSVSDDREDKPLQVDEPAFVADDDMVDIADESVSSDDVVMDDELPSEIDMLIGDDDLVDEMMFDDETEQTSSSDINDGPDDVDVKDGLAVSDEMPSKTQSALPEVLLPFIETAKATTHEPMEVDEDIREIYIEEAGEVLETIIPLFDKYQSSPDKGTLTDIRRGFHTLKGSGRMVGAYELGELAWSIENMLNRVLDETVPMDAGMQALIGDVLGEFDALVSIFESKADDYPAKIKLWEAVAHAYSKGHGKDFDYRMLDMTDGSDKNTATQNANAEDSDDIDRADDVAWQSLDDEVLGSEPVLTESSVEDESSQDTIDDKTTQQADHTQDDETGKKTKPTHEALSLVEQAGQLMSSTTPSSPVDDEEDMLCQIFIEEARELLAEVTTFLNAHEADSQTPVDNNVVRAFHTLRGASGLAPLVAVGEVGAIIERGLQSLQHHDAPMGNKHKQALKNAVAFIDGYLDAYNQTDGNLITAQELGELAEDKQEIEELMLDESDVYHVESLIEGIDELLDAELELEGMSAKEQNVICDYAKTQLAQIDMLSARTHDLPKFQSLLASLKPAYELMAEHADQAKDDSFIDALLAVHHELIGLFDAMAGSMALTVDKAVLNNLSTITLERENYYQELGNTLKEQSKTEESADSSGTASDEGASHSDSQTAPIRLEVIATDDELLEIFLDEALELDAEVTEVFGQWRDDKDNLDHLKTLQRHLHTIKGGARLAGISSIGDLTHEAESVYERFTNKQMTVTDPWVRTMQRVQDVLSLQLDAVKNTKQSFFADNTIADLQAYLSAGEVPEGAMIAIPVLDTKKEEQEAVATPEITEVPLDETSRYQHFISESWQGVLSDKDILDVFLEEAKELAESSSEDFAAFRNNTSDVVSLQSLQRKLHTIKGGARMVSANGVADLAHEMETVYEELGNRRLPATRMVANLLFACHDWITSAVGLLEHNYNPPRPTPLVDALHRFIKNPDDLNEVPVVSLEKEIDFINEYQAFLAASKNTRDISRMPPMKGVFGESVDSSSNNEMIRISAPLLERMINLSGEAAINRARIDMNLASITGSIEEMGVTVQRLFDQLRRMDIELEEQIMAQIDDGTFDEDFDPLEMDQYSSLNQLSKSLSESASDLLDIKATMLDKTRDGENLLLQLSRTQADLQDSLMNSRMVPFSRLTPRLQRIVRLTASELGKNVELTVINADDEMDRSILDRITSPLEHMLRNAVDHGVEMPTKRSELGKPLTGRIVLEVLREGGEMVILLSDDGSGVNVEAVRNKAISQGLIHPDEQLADNDIMQYIFNAGLSTTNKVTQISGRGVGMDVVRTEIRQLGGSVSVESEFGKGSRFIIRVPLTVSMSDALIVRVADRQYAIPLVQIERVVQMNATELLAYHQSGNNTIKIDNKNYRLRYLNEILTGSYFNEIISGVTLPVIIIKTQTGQALALQVDEIVGSRIEIVVKPLGRQLSNLSGISAATIMGDGSVMLILDLLALMRTAQAKRESKEMEPVVSRRHLIMVADDSVTVRKVTSRFLERQGFEVIVAKDGVDAIEILQDNMPDLMLLDIEMPRMDGFEVATQVRHSPRLSHLPIIMITSRTGEKHRDRAFEIGVNDYMGKPFQEVELLERIGKLLNI
ncbi:Hpt domain-containing protein [Moraxella sp. K1630]|uniref:Hpt domain-containing protein n=1 Tax=Moraxella sp. K1630 TaxID=2780078 RepID=UPI001880A6E3|nr:Hpt domain-containing protein [Moraxella sp. K1630]MBE9587431.1 Hpt domain-containing protein [Moraxella sp. K1630]